MKFFPKLKQKKSCHKIRILFTGGGGAGSEILYKLLKKKYILFFGDSEINNISPYIPQNKKVKIPWAHEKKYVKKLNKICRCLRINLLIPGVDEELLQLAKLAQKNNGMHILLPDYEYVNTMLDKWKMIQAFNNKQIRAPKSVLGNKSLTKIKFPCVAKPRTGRGSRGIYFIENRTAGKGLKNILQKKNRDYIFQQKVSGQEFTVQMIADAKYRLRSIVPVRVDKKRGITIQGTIVNDSSVAKKCAIIHNKIPAKGCYNIQLIKDKMGYVWPFEINPRVSTTFCLAVASGLDPIAIYLGKKSRKCKIYKKITLRRFWQNQIERKK